MRARRSLADDPDFTLDLHGAFLRRTDLSRTNLRRANFAGADFSFATFREANFEDVNLKGTILKGADLTGVRNLTPEQLAEAVLDEHTKLPDYLVGKLPVAAAAAE